MAHLTDLELYYFNEGTTVCAYESMGCHPVTIDGKPAYRFALWAPNAKRIGVSGEFNGWSDSALPMERIGETGVWEAFSFEAKEGQLYKFAVLGADEQLIYKADPYAFCAEPHGTASKIYSSSDFPWTDGTYLKKHKKPYNKPMNIYEVHLGSWRANQSYRELAHSLIDYVVDMGYTHIEVMPLMAYPFDPSWGYQVTGYYAATSRYGSPDDLKYFINRAHEKGIGVIMDWVPAHFTRDGYGLARFDGSALYEHADPRRSDMKQWGTLLFDYEKPQVQSFLISNAIYWLKEFHFDGLRVDAVSCMLYLDYGRQDGEWLPNKNGGKENLAAIEMFKKLATAIDKLHGGKLLIAEESTAFPMVTSKHGKDSLGFDFKWNMGWMNDMLSYMQMDSLFRKWHHEKLTFSLMYAFSERYILPFSHDEVVHGKLSMLNKMPGDYWQKFAQLRLLYLYQMTHPGKKLTFMGMEFGQFIEWRFDDSLDWLLLDYPKHVEMQRFVRALNKLYKTTPALYENDDDWNGFQWIAVDDSIHSIASFLRKDRKGNTYLCAFNFTPVPWDDYCMGSRKQGVYEEIFSTDPYCYGGTGQYENGAIETVDEAWGQFPFRIRLKLAPYGALILKFTEKGKTK
ncbi:MAG: 1,4-alpha-glucan branching protein GlgB [Clostridia bacterium]|nr:1,4-alpha-glucan branching protein GlgB [Clostridia bacterium]